MLIIITHTKLLGVTSSHCRLGEPGGKEPLRRQAFSQYYYDVSSSTVSSQNFPDWVTKKWHEPHWVIFSLYATATTSQKFFWQFEYSINGKDCYGGTQLFPTNSYGVVFEMNDLKYILFNSDFLFNSEYHHKLSTRSFPAAKLLDWKPRSPNRNKRNKEKLVAILWCFECLKVNTCFLKNLYLSKNV